MAIENIRTKVKTLKGKPPKTEVTPEATDSAGASPSNKKVAGIFNKSLTLGLKAGLQKLVK